MSEGNVYQLIAAVSSEMALGGISKSRTNSQQGYKFRGIDDVYNALAPVLAKYKLVIVPRFLSREVVERTTQKGGLLFNVTVEGEFDFISAIDGSKHTARTFGEAMDSADKATNKAMSAAYKYAAFQAFCIPTEGDNDADATTHDVAGEHQDGPPAPETIEGAQGTYRPTDTDRHGPSVSRPRGAGLTVTSVTEAASGVSDKGAWTLYAVKFSDGREATTFSASIKKAAEQAQREGVSVQPVIEMAGTKKNLKSLARVQ